MGCKGEIVLREIAILSEMRMVDRRHTFAARMHLAGVPLDVIQRQLGHNDLSITGAYLRRIGADVVHQTMTEFSLE